MRPRPRQKAAAPRSSPRNKGQGHTGRGVDRDGAGEAHERQAEPARQQIAGELHLVADDQVRALRFRHFPPARAQLVGHRRAVGYGPQRAPQAGRAFGNGEHPPAVGIGSAGGRGVRRGMAPVWPPAPTFNRKQQR